MFASLHIYALAYAELILNGDTEQYLNAVTVKSFFD
ncbi:MAG: DUF6061 family protein [Phascolarctobacterium succinatutens]